MRAAAAAVTLFDGRSNDRARGPRRCLRLHQLLGSRDESAIKFAGLHIQFDISAQN
jgi:hypothetical protein